MKKIWLIVLVLFSLAPLCAEEAVVPATASEAFANHFNSSQQFFQNNKRGFKIAGNIAKIAGALSLLHLFQNIKGVRPYAFLQNAGFCEKMIRPAVWVDGDWDATQHAYTNVKISNLAGSYLSILPIAAYLFGSGSYDLYTMFMTKSEESTEQNTPEQNTSEPNKAATVEEKISHTETIPQPEETHQVPNFDEDKTITRPKYTPIRLSSND